MHTPGTLEKVSIKGKAYVDGGLRNNAPVDDFEKEHIEESVLLRQNEHLVKPRYFDFK